MTGEGSASRGDTASELFRIGAFPILWKRTVHSRSRLGFYLRELRRAARIMFRMSLSTAHLRRLALAAVLTVAAGQSPAQNILNIGEIPSIATMLMSDGRYNACGLRFVGVDFTEPISYPVHTFDFNISMMRGTSATQLFAVLKTEVTRYSTLTELKARSGRLMAVRKAWLQPEGKPPLVALGKPVAGENKVSLMVPYEVDGMLDAMVSAAGGEKPNWLLGIAQTGSPNERIYRFVPTVNQEDADAFFACSKALLDQVIPKDK